MRVISGASRPLGEMRAVLEGAELSPEQMSEGMSQLRPESLKSSAPDLFVIPRTGLANQPWTDVGVAEETRIAFFLPSAELAQQAFSNIRSIGPIHIGQLGRDRLLRYPMDFGEGHAQGAVVFDVAGADGAHYVASLVFNGLIREGHPRWAGVKRTALVDDKRSLEMSWELRTSRPGAVRWRHGSDETSIQMNAPTGNPAVHRIEFRVVFSEIKPGRVRLHTKLGTQPSDVEMDGDFDALAREFRMSAEESLKIERGGGPRCAASTASLWPCRSPTPSPRQPASPTTAPARRRRPTRTIPAGSRSHARVTKTTSPSRDTDGSFAPRAPAG